MGLIDAAGAKSLMTWLPNSGMDLVEATITKDDQQLTLVVRKETDLATLKVLCAQNGAKLETRELVSAN